MSMWKSVVLMPPREFGKNELHLESSRPNHALKMLEQNLGQRHSCELFYISDKGLCFSKTCTKKRKAQIRKDLNKEISRDKIFFSFSLFNSLLIPNPENNRCTLRGGFLYCLNRGEQRPKHLFNNLMSSLTREEQGPRSLL